jgi:hypothetical protein
MLSLNEIKIKLKDRNLYEVSRRIGVPPTTLWRIANDKGESVAYSTVEKVSNYLTGEE